MVIGGGQAGLAAGYHLRRAGVDFVILDAQDGPRWRLAARLALAAPVLPGAVQLAARADDAVPAGGGYPSAADTSSPT